MLKICDKFAAEYSVTFNIDKYQLIHYTRYLEIYGIKHNCIFIKCHDYANHLGHVIGPRSKKELHLRITKKFISSFHGINAIFSRAHVNDVFVRCGNIKDLLHIRDYKCTKLELNEINCLLKVLCTD